MRALILCLVLALICSQLVLWFSKGGIRDVSAMRAQVEQQRLDIVALKERNQSLAAEVLDLKEGLEAIEERARSEMGMIKEGEVFYQVIESANGANADIANENE